MVREDVGEFLNIGDTPATEKLKKFLVAVARVNDFVKMLSLRPRDNSDSRTCKLTDKGFVRVDQIQQMSAVHTQCAHPGFV